MNELNKLLVEQIELLTGINGYSTKIHGDKYYFLSSSNQETLAAKVYDNKGEYFYLKDTSKGRIEGEYQSAVMSLVLVNSPCFLSFYRKLECIGNVSCNDYQITKVVATEYDLNSTSIIDRENGFIPLSKTEIAEIKINLRWNYITDCNC